MSPTADVRVPEAKQSFRRKIEPHPQTEELRSHALWNKASEKVLLRNGMIFERYVAEGFKKNGEWVEENLLVINREQWNKIS